MSVHGEHEVQRGADIPDDVLDTALQWAVTLGSGTSMETDNEAFATWLAADPAHQAAWRRMQVVEQEFTPARHVEAASSTLDRVAGNRRRVRRRRMLGGIVSALLVVGIVLGSGGLEHWRYDHVTGIGERQRVDFAGGGVMFLNADTVLDVDRHGGDTVVRLHRGEIYVDTRGWLADTKPLVVTVDARLVPVGTRFVVSRDRSGTELSITGGEVAVLGAGGGASADAIVLGRAGESWRIIEGQARRLDATGMDPATWVNGIVEADDAPLGGVLDALGSHRRGWLRYDDAAAKIRVTGVFRLDDTDGALRALERTLPVRVQRLTPWWINVKAIPDR